MEAAGIVARLREKLFEAVLADGVGDLDPWVQIEATKVHEALQVMRDDPVLAFDFLMAITGLDLMGLSEKPDLRVIYHLYSYQHRHAINVRADVARENPVIPSASDLWPAANWAEREVMDLLGVRFEGHPDPRRILLPPEWEGHPLRKDYREGAFALGFSTSRATPMQHVGKD